MDNDRVDFIDDNTLKNVDNCRLKEGIWFISDNRKCILVEDIKNLPEALTAIQFLPYKDELCKLTAKMLYNKLPLSLYLELVNTMPTINVAEYMIKMLTKLINKGEKDNA